jgi:hypothetical protein
MLDALVAPAMAGDALLSTEIVGPARKPRNRSAERSRHRPGTREARRLPELMVASRPRNAIATML